MPKHYTLEFKKHHIEAWRASGQTRRQYCESHGINEGTFKHWSSQIKASHRSTAGLPSVLPVQIAQPSAPEALADPVMVYLPVAAESPANPLSLAMSSGP